MNFIESIKSTSKNIIELSRQLDGRVNTWDEEKSAPSGGFSDRAGYLMYDDIELLADICSIEGETLGRLRTRLSWVHSDEEGQDSFTIIVLDFNTDLQKAISLTSNSKDLTQEKLITLLNDPDTIPYIIQASLDNSGLEPEGKTFGKRYEYSDEELQNLSETEQAEFLDTLEKAYAQILSKL